MGIADAMLKMIDKIISEEDVSEINSVTLEIGDLSGVVPHFMADCWEAVCDGTRYEKTKLIIETVPGTLRCEDCLNEFTADLDKLYCPKCKSNKLTPLSGRELSVKEVEIK